MNDMTDIDRDALARVLYDAGVHTDADDDRYFCGQVADAVIAHLATTHPPTDTGLRQVGWLGPYGLIPGGMDNEPHPKWLPVYARLAAPDPGPDQADGLRQHPDFGFTGIEVLRVGYTVPPSAVPDHLWTCGCLRNESGAHRVGCPDHPEGVNPRDPDRNRYRPAPDPGPDAADPEGSQR